MGNNSIPKLSREEIKNRYICIDHFDDKYTNREFSKRRRLTKTGVPIHYEEFWNNFAIPSTSQEKNGKGRRLSTSSQASRSDNTELEKFKRRLIRAVARMLLHEKRNEDEVWMGLKKETGCDCKELWNRMQALTIKKLNRLLEAQDRVDMMPTAARMSITDWLLFDKVLVHDDSFDVVGMTETSTKDRKVLLDLFELVEKYKLEFLAGDELADAWSAATMAYNKDNRQCTPMLLQRRWYQLKLATRARFYKFWSMYKGVVKRLKDVEMYKPTPLQTEIAKKYKPLVIMPIMMWEDLVKNKLVILPEEFERRGLEKQEADENTPDVMCLEPDVETINLDEDSDIELEYRKPPTNNVVPAVSIKQEPKDIDEMEYDDTVPYENRQEKISHFAEAVMQATAMELDEIDLDVDETTGNAKDPDEVTLSEDNSEVQTIEDEDKRNADEVEITEDPVIDLPTENKAPVIHIAKPEVDDVDDNVAIDGAIETVKEPEIVLPQITSVFGGVDVSNETLSKIGMLTAQITNSKTTVTDETTEKDLTSKEVPIEISSDSIEDDPGIVAEDVSNQGLDVQEEKMDVNIKAESDISKNSWFGELSNDIDFADDGIQLVDDGIAYQDDECAYQMGEIKKENDGVKLEIVSESEEEDVPKVDKKLLMLPQVKVLKLDDMGILPVNLLQHVDDKNIIDIIDFKNKPIKPIIKEEDTKSESSEESVIEDIKKVKLTSNLLQKPRSRSYNPIQLCKNPDFNTRLKRLSIGFFSSSRNCSLLKACKPLTIDVSKAFESRLVDGTIYLDVVKDEKIPVKIDLTESNQNVSVVPTAMAVQSLIDNNEDVVNTDRYPPAMPNPVEAVTPVAERSKTINLPDITEIRRINQRLLIAEVTPLQVQNNIAQVPVSIVPSNIPDNVKTVDTKSDFKRMPGPASRTKLMPKVVDITKNTVNNLDTTPQVTNLSKNKDMVKPVEKSVPWKPKTKSEVPWNNVNTNIYSADTLLALDTLNKMLFILSKEDLSKVTQMKPKKLKSVIKKQLKQDKTPPPPPPPTLEDDNDDVQVISETKRETNTNEIKKVRKQYSADPNKKRKPIYCCWAREKICQLIFHKKRITKHNCPYPLCLCCCQQALKEYQKREVEKQEIKRKKQNQQTIGTQIDLDPVQENVKINTNVDVSTDVAEIIPIFQKDSEATVSTNTVTTIENEEHDSSVNIIADDEDDVVCSDEATIGEIVVVSSNSTATASDKATSTENGQVKETAEVATDSPEDVLQEAEVSIIDPKSTDTPSIESTNTDKTLNTTYMKTDMKPPPPPTKHRFRVKFASGPVVTDARRKTKLEEPVKVTAGKPPVAKRQAAITVRQDLVVPPNQSISVQNNLNIDTSKTKLSQKSYANQKMIYLNSKQISELPSDNPIFLGKNKILLTTAKFPANFKAFEAFQRNIRQTLALPKGIQLLLQPNGRVTYIRDPKIRINDAFMATMPHLIEAVQQQIDSTVASAIQASITTTQRQSEVINLIDDETPVEKSGITIEDDSDSVNDQAKSTSNEDNVETRMPEIQIDIMAQAGSTDDSATESSVKQMEQHFHISENITQEEQSVQITEDVTEKALNIVSENTSSSTDIVEYAEIANTKEIADLTEIPNAKEINEGTEIPNTSEISESAEIPNAKESGESTTISHTIGTTESIEMRITADIEQSIEINNTTETENSTEITNSINSGESTEKADSINSGESTDITENTDQSKTVDLSTDTDVMPVDDDHEPRSKENSSGKTKNILSDLMAMSGIEPLDISQDSPIEPTAEVPPADTLQLATPSISLAMPSQTLQQSLSNLAIVPVLSPNAGEPKIPINTQNTNVLPQALTAITSLSELKFACSQNGLFFKLDLESGLLVPIHVCMKKFEAQSAQSGRGRQQTRTIAPRPFDSGVHISVESREPKPVIDLTEDDTPEEPSDQTPPVLLNTFLADTERSPLKSILISSQPTAVGGVSPNKVVESTSESVTTEVRNPSLQAKPLKLFKAGGRPLILERKLKEIRRRISKAMAQDVFRRRIKRKQELTQTLDPDPRIIDPNFGQLTLDENSSDCSSDEEPLASVAIKMRATEREAAMNRSLLKKRKLNLGRPMYYISEAKKQRTAIPNVDSDEEAPELIPNVVPEIIPLIDPKPTSYMNPIPSTSPGVIPNIVPHAIADVAGAAAADVDNVEDEPMSADEDVDDDVNNVHRPWAEPVESINEPSDPPIVPIACHMDDNEDDDDNCILGV